MEKECKKQRSRGGGGGKMKTDREGEWKDKWQRGKRAREKGRVRDRR